MHKCILCGSTERKLVASQSFKDSYLDLVDPSYQSLERSLLSCVGCGFVYHDPQLDEGDAQVLYEKFRDFMFRNESADEYFDRITNYSPEESENYQKVKWIKEVVPAHVNKGGKLLDVGCGGGVFLYTFLQNTDGWSTWGIEPTSAFAELAARRLNCPVVAAAYTRGIFKNVKYDLITVNQVLEHLLDPLKFLTDISSELNEGGYLYLEVPDISDLLELPDNHDRFQMQHLWIFSKETLKKLCEMANLRVVNIDVVRTLRGRANVVALVEKGVKN